MQEGAEHAGVCRHGDSVANHEEEQEGGVAGLENGPVRADLDHHEDDVDGGNHGELDHGRHDPRHPVGGRAHAHQLHRFL